MDDSLKDKRYFRQVPSGFEMRGEDYEKYLKHIFYVDGCNYEVQKHDEKESVVLKLTGRGTCSIPDQKPADFVIFAFFKEGLGNKPPRYGDNGSYSYLYIPYPLESLENIINIIKTSKKTYAQLFYYGVDNKQCYADIHGILK